MLPWDNSQLRASRTLEINLKLLSSPKTHTDVYLKPKSANIMVCCWEEFILHIFPSQELGFLINQQNNNLVIWTKINGLNVESYDAAIEGRMLTI